jgi:hypothetical protein
MLFILLHNQANPLMHWDYSVVSLIWRTSAKDSRAFAYASQKTDISRENCSEQWAVEMYPSTEVDRLSCRSQCTWQGKNTFQEQQSLWV